MNQKRPAVVLTPGKGPAPLQTPALSVRLMSEFPDIENDLNEAISKPDGDRPNMCFNHLSARSHFLTLAPRDMFIMVFELHISASAKRRSISETIRTVEPKYALIVYVERISLSIKHQTSGDVAP